MCHKYDEEWRIILNGAMQMPICCEWIPTSVYLGLNMSAEEMATVMDAAKEAGIETIYKCVITDEGTLGAVLAESL